MPTHHNLDHYLEEYIAAAGIGEDRKGPQDTGSEVERLIQAIRESRNVWIYGAEPEAGFGRRVDYYNISTFCCSNSAYPGSLTRWNISSP